MPRKPFQIAEALSMLSAYGEKLLGLQPMDRVYAENQLISLFNVSEPAKFDGEIPDLQTKILDPIVKYAIKAGMIPENEALLFETKLMGLVTPSPGAVITTFDNVASTEGIESATSYLNLLSLNSNYIRKADVLKNIKWTAPGEMGDLTITINLAKPEKDNKQVELEKSLPQTKYPRCMLCKENVGYAGALNYPPRQTLRTIPISLGGEEWHLQFRLTSITTII
jgi:Galactose-1-phosphate uridyltransferase